MTMPRDMFPTICPEISREAARALAAFATL